MKSERGIFRDYPPLRFHAGSAEYIRSEVGNKLRPGALPQLEISQRDRGIAWTPGSAG